MNQWQSIIEFLASHDLSCSEVSAFLARVQPTKDGLADLYFQSGEIESLSLEEGVVKWRSADRLSGVGVRSINQEEVRFAYADGITKQGLSAAVDRIVCGPGVQPQPTQQPSRVNSLYEMASPFAAFSMQQRMQLLRRVDRVARAQDQRVQRVSVSLSGSDETVLVAREDGAWSFDKRPMVRLDVQVVVAQAGRVEKAVAGGGGRYGYAEFLHDDRCDHYAREAVRVACLNLTAEPAPAGEMPVVLGAGWPGVLFHEAVGHGLEADAVHKKSSVYTGQCGQRVASSLCTIVDDGTLPGCRGSLHVDDEGTETARNVLVENGVLKQYMHDRHSAMLMGARVTGNGRRESYAHLPMPRMTNTFLLPGEDCLEDMIGSINKGIYAVGFSGGQVDTTSGQFVFSTSEAYLIEQGRVTCPVRQSTLIGSGSDVMQRISMVGQEMQLDPGVGVCGKAGQSVPVCVGQPALKIDAITVGGQCVDNA